MQKSGSFVADPTSLTEAEQSDTEPPSMRVWGARNHEYMRRDLVQPSLRRQSPDLPSGKAGSLDLVQA